MAEHPSLMGIALPFTIFGAFAHQCIRTREIDNRIWSLVALYLGIWVSVCAGEVQLYSLPLVTALKSTVLAASFFNLGLVTSILLYRIFFHRLNHFPGPWSAKVSRLLVMRDAAKSTQYHLDLDRMHHQYGDFVRTGPRELSINRVSAVMALYGQGSQCTRSPWYSHVSDDSTQTSLNSTRDPEVHRRRRRAWDRGFSVKALATYEPRVQQKIGVFIEQLRSIQQPVDITQWSMYLSFDMMGLVGFSRDFHQLEDATEHAAIKELHEQMLILGILKPVPWILTILGAIQGLVGNYGQFMIYCEQQIAEKKKEWNHASDKTPADVISWLLKASEENDQSAPPGDQALNEDGRLMIIAGSDTTGVTLAHAFYYLAKHPAVYKKLQAELDAVRSDFTYEAFRSLPYLNAVINETLRLKPAVPSGQPRLTPPGGLQIDEVWVPGETIVVVPQHVIHRDERYFAQGDEFIPERWLDGTASQEAFFPFQIGRYGCVGRQLALMQLRSTIARVALTFDIAFAPGMDDGDAFDKEALDTFTYTVGALRMVLTERSKSQI